MRGSKIAWGLAAGLLTSGALVAPAHAQTDETVSQLAQQVAQLQKQSDAARDRQQVENLFSRYMYLHNAFEDEQIIPLWAAEGTEGMSAQYSNLGKYTQYEKIMEYHRGRPSPIGKLLFHYITTPVIEVAGDGKTAKGLWIVNGLESGLTAPEHAANMPDWMFEPNVEVDGKKVWMHNVYLKYGIDFIKQDGEWKIWHFHCFEVARAPYSMGWIPFAAAAQDDSFNFDLMYVGDDGAPVFMPETDEPATVLNNTYRTDTAQHLEARIPEPYNTFSETFSY
ncbi:MAG: nuclear transport factor 2 family protein [Erythrobacter sp.]|nr:nuclear transport factor 2 family protein [Erythrobacter sp.]NCQ63030.1 nuclear transport factor 2 family protein [Alphaproteobacteria bacterium]